MAVANLKKINADREMRQILEAREKEARHVATIRKIARDEGLEAGRAEGEVKGRAEGEAKGLLKGKKETAIKLYALGIDLRLISNATGLSEPELQEILNPQPGGTSQ